MARSYSGTRTAAGTRSEAAYSSSTELDAYLLQETADFLLLETNDKIILDGVTTQGGGGTAYRSNTSTSRTSVT